MKKYLLSLLLLTVTLTLSATERPMAKMRQAAVKTLNANKAKATLSKPTLEVYNDGSSFTIVSRDDRFPEVLAYGVGNFDIETAPANVKWWFEAVQRSMEKAVKENAPRRAATTYTAVAPMMTTKWGQNAPYNNYCPVFEKEKTKAPTGCVATAMAQIMKYWNYPTKGIGSKSYIPTTHPEYGTLSASFIGTTYQWSSMPNKVTTSSSTTAQTAVATLMYHCGVAVSMNYKTSAEGGSGAYTILPETYINNGYIDAATALNKYFGYNTVGYYRNSYSDNNWKTILKGELDAGRPILYAGQSSSSGHAFVCDGYNSSDYFHFNWGWSGNSDNYYLISALNPPALGTGGGTGGGFNTNQKIVTIAPPSDIDLRHYGRMLLAQSGSNLIVNTTQTMPKNTAFFLRDTIANFGTGTFNGTFRYDVLNANKTTIVGEVGSKAIELEGKHYTFFTINNTTGLSLSDGTYYVRGAYKESSSSTWYTISDGNYSNLYAFTIKTVLGIDDKETFKTLVYPNPAQNIVHFQATENLENAVAEFVDISGKVVYRTAFSGQEIAFDISEFAKGIYILKVNLPNNCLTYKIVKQ